MSLSDLLWRARVARGRVGGISTFTNAARTQTLALEPMRLGFTGAIVQTFDPPYSIEGPADVWVEVDGYVVNADI